MEQGKCHVAIEVDVNEEGRIEIKTDEELIPTTVAQQILDQVVAKVTKVKMHDIDDALVHRIAATELKLKIWQGLTIGFGIAFIIALLKVKGII